MNLERYKYAVASVVKADLSNVKNNKEISDELYDKSVTLIYTCIETQVVTTGASVGASTAITKGDIYKRKILDIDAAHQLQ